MCQWTQKMSTSSGARMNGGRASPANVAVVELAVQALVWAPGGQECEGDGDGESNESGDHDQLDVDGTAVAMVESTVWWVT